MQEKYRKSEVQLRKFAKNQKYKYRILCARKNGTKICHLPSAILRPSDKTLENARRP